MSTNGGECPGYNKSAMAVRFQSALAIIAVCALCAFATPAHAQLTLRGASDSLTIAFSPLSPNPGEMLNLTVQSSLIEISEARILWQANGKTIAEGPGVRSASVPVGALGTETRIDVTATTPDGAEFSGHATIIPTELDLLVDSDSYTPPFYLGRPRSSAGSNLHLQALPRFKRAGQMLSASGLTYTWRRNSEVLGSISGLGKSTARIPVLHLFGTDTISVEARSPDGLLSHTSSFSLSAGEPMLALYEDHPLYGVLYNRALPASTFIQETEMTFAAVPFFVPTRSVYDPELAFLWHVNGAEIPTHPTDPNELTINAQNSSGIALVALEISHASNYYLDVKGAWNITFSSSSNDGTVDQFRTLGQ